VVRNGKSLMSKQGPFRGVAQRNLGSRYKRVFGFDGEEDPIRLWRRERRETRKKKEGRELGQGFSQGGAIAGGRGSWYRRLAFKEGRGVGKKRVTPLPSTIARRGSGARK